MESSPVTKWKNSTKKLTLGVSFATVLLLLYNVFLFVPPLRDRHGDGSNMLLLLGFLLLVLALCYCCIVNYCRGLSRFAVNFEEGGKRALFMIRWAFLLTLAGVVMQLLIFRAFALSTLTFGQIILGNVLWLAATVLGIVGFLSLATARGTTDEGRKGAAHMAWVLVVLFAGACLVSYVLQTKDGVGALLKVAAIAVNLFGACCFFKQWKRILTPPDDEPAEDEEENAA